MLLLGSTCEEERVGWGRNWALRWWVLSWYHNEFWGSPGIRQGSWLALVGQTASGKVVFFGETFPKQPRVVFRRWGCWGITFIAKQKLPTVSAGECAETLSVYTDKDGNKAVIPSGWTVSGVSEENNIWGKDVSLVIYRIPKENTSKTNWENPDELEVLKKTYDQLVWCPVELLDADGTLDG